MIKKLADITAAHDALMARGKNLLDHANDPRRVRAIDSPGLLPPKREDASKPRPGFIQRNGKV